MAAEFPDHLFGSLDSLANHAFVLSTPKKGSGTSKQAGRSSAVKDGTKGPAWLLASRLKEGSKDASTPSKTPAKTAVPSSTATKAKVKGVKVAASGAQEDRPPPSKVGLAQAVEPAPRPSSPLPDTVDSPAPPVSASPSPPVSPTVTPDLVAPTDPEPSIPTLAVPPDTVAHPVHDHAMLEIVDLTSDDEVAVQEIIERSQPEKAGPSTKDGARAGRGKGRTSVFKVVGPSISNRNSPRRPSPEEDQPDSQHNEEDARRAQALADELFPPSPPRAGPSSPPRAVKSEPGLAPTKPRSPGRRITIIDLGSSSDSDSEDDAAIELANTSVESATSALRRTPPTNRINRPSVSPSDGKKKGLPSPTKRRPRVSEVLAEARDESSSDEDSDDFQLMTPRVERRRSPRLSDISDPGAGILEFVPTPRRPPVKLLPSTPKTPARPQARPPQPPKTAPPKKHTDKTARHPLSNIIDFTDSPEQVRPSSAPTTTIKSRPLPPKAAAKPHRSQGDGPLTGRAFVLRRDALAASLVASLDSTVFSHRLPPSLRIIWSKRLNTTAGRASWRRTKDSAGQVVGTSAEVELATKVVDDEDKLRNTLAHELCHIAAYAIDGQLNPPHGPAFKSWAKKVMRARSDIHVSVTHSYEIEYKFKWRCLDPSCGHIFQRHSKSIDPARHGCHCGSRLEALERTKKHGGGTKRGQDLENDDLVRAMRAVEID